MIRRNRSRKIHEQRSRLGRRAFWAAFLVVAVYLLVPMVLGDMGIVQYLKMRRTYDSLQQEIRHLTEQNEAIENEVRALRSDPVEIERLARARLGLVRPGEVVYQFETDRSEEPVKNP